MPKLAKTLQTLLDDVDVRGAAARGLASMPSEHTAKLLLEKMPSWSADEQADALQTLASNTKMGLALLDAVESQKLARNRIDAFTVRQLLNLKSKEVNARVEKVWGSVRIPSKEKAATLAKYKAELGPDKLKTASAANGRALYAKHCGICHKLYGEGGDVGPELTGSQRHNLDYLLDNVLDPNAILPREYYMVVVTTQAGRVITGIVKRETETALVLRTQNEEVVISKADIDSRTSSNVSLMPEGIFQGLRIEEVRDLVAYLTSTRQP
jgi:putative heme-binding domain-containing protein